MTFGGDRVESLFSAAAEFSEAERRAYLDRHCAGEPDLRAQVEQLLHADRSAGGDYLEPSATEVHVSPGTRIGRYTIGEILGEGGMGVVYSAHQVSPRREVALKIIRPDKVSPTTVRRFRREAELLGSLQHSGIAHVFEAGAEPVETANGRRTTLHYMAMELVRGERLLEFVEREGLDRRARIELLAAVCDAVSHAHERGIVHRDLKPDNVLVVGSNDARGFAPKLLDFGIAIGADDELAHRNTLDGQIVGSLVCMSPEQASGDPSRVDARTDIYALGVLLYRTLAGRDPIDTDTCSVVEAVRRISEGRPARLAAHDPSLQGDLSVIAAKALERDPGRRYSTAKALADDLRLHLRGLPIVARMDSAWYVLGKTIRRYRSASFAVLAAFVVLGAFAAHSARQSAHLARELIASRIERARLVGSAGNFELAEEMLWRSHLVDPDSLHSYWALWELYARDPSLGAWATDEKLVSALAFHPDGLYFASSQAGPGVAIWDPSGRGLLQVLETGSKVESLDIAKDGRTLVAGTVDGSLALHAASELVPLRQFAAHEGSVFAVSLDPSGERLASGGEDALPRVWNLEGVLQHELAVTPGPINVLGWSPTGDLLAVGSEGRIRVHAAGGGGLLWNERANPVVRSLAFTSDGLRLATAGDGRSVFIFDARSGEQLQELTTQNGAIRFLEFDPRAPGELWASGWWKLLAWDLEGETARPLLHVAVDHATPEGSFARLASGALGQIRLWDLRPRHALRLPGSDGATVAAAGPTTRRVVLLAGETLVRIHDLDTGVLLGERDLAGSPVHSVEFTPDEEFLVVARSKGIELVDPSTWETSLRQGEPHQGYTLGSVACSLDGRFIAYTATGGHIALCDRRTFEPKWVAEVTSGKVLSVAFSPDGAQLTATHRDVKRSLHEISTWSVDGTLTWEAETSELQYDGSTHQFTPWALAYSHDGKLVAAGGWGDLVVIWRADTGRLVAVLRDHQAVVWDIAFHPDDANLLVSASDDGTAKLWDVGDERCLATFVSPGDRGEMTTSVSFGPEGERLVVGGFDGVTIWDLTYFERHIAGNLPLQLDRFEEDMGMRIDRTALTSWASAVLGREQARSLPAAPPATDPVKSGRGH